MKKKKLKVAFKLAKKVFGRITEEILITLRGQESFSEYKQRLYGFPIYKKELSSKRLYPAMERMKKQGWVEKKIIQDKIYYSLTKEGNVKRLLIKLKRHSKQRGEKATVLIFDIPEEKRTFRNFLRRLLKQTGFIMLQRSVFLTPYILPKEFYDLLQEMKILQYVMVLEGELRFQTKA